MLYSYKYHYIYFPTVFIQTELLYHNPPSAAMFCVFCPHSGLILLSSFWSSYKKKPSDTVDIHKTDTYGIEDFSTFERKLPAEI